MATTIQRFVITLVLSLFASQTKGFLNYSPLFRPFYTVSRRLHRLADAPIVNYIMSVPYKNMTVVEFANILKNDDLRKQFQIIDLREEKELEIAKLPYPGIYNYPMTKAKYWFAEAVDGRRSKLKKNIPTICFCQDGARSFPIMNFFGKSINFLMFSFLFLKYLRFIVRSAKFENMSHVVGGLDAYSEQIDPSIPKYEFTEKFYRSSPKIGRSYHDEEDDD
jgi:rhodanese-related sulfurtransferase